MTFLKYWYRVFVVICMLAFVHVRADADSDAAIEQLLQQPDPPIGVVFEIISPDPNALAWAIPKAERYIEQLKSRFPKIETAVVSHGFEQFSLLDEKTGTKPDIHRLAQEFLAIQETSIQVCGNHAGMYGYEPDAFSSYVEVVPSAPGQIKHYQELGYALVVLREL